MIINKITIKQNGSFLNAWYQGKLFFEVLDNQSKLEANKKLITQCLDYGKRTGLQNARVSE